MKPLMMKQLISIPSTRSVVATANAVENQLIENGFSIFLRLDQQKVAKKVGLSMPGMEVILFGKPEIGTRLMNQYPSIAIDLPLKLVIQEDQLYTSVIQMNSLQAIAERHGIDKPIFNGLVELLQMVSGEEPMDLELVSRDSAVYSA